jgi:hypothetical protein
MKKKLLFLLLIAISSLSAQLLTPLEQSNYTTLSTNAELVNYIRLVVEKTSWMKMDTLAFSVNGKPLPVVTISKGKNKEKIKVLIFAQQHGDEPSGKEGALMLLRDFANGKNDALLTNVDLYLVPQMNPDGNDIDTRRNGHKMDLNRNHMIMTEPEVIGLHEFYAKIDPEVTLDVHEYSPYGKEWKEFGYRKNSEETIGLMTNPNTDDALRSFQRENFLPFLYSYMQSKKVRFGEYTPMGPPNKERMRNSTVDINDGRQSFGILGSFSFIQEGMNGLDSIDNIRRRSEAQCIALTGFITFMNENADTIRAMVKSAKATRAERAVTAIQMDHVSDGEKKLKFSSYDGLRDTTIVTANYHTKIIPLVTVTRPKGYLVPKNDELLKDFLAKHKFKAGPYKPAKNDTVKQYAVEYDSSLVIEEFVIPGHKARPQTTTVKASDYLFVPIGQRQAQLLIQAFEPHCMINLLQYERFGYLMKEKFYPILRVE